MLLLPAACANVTLFQVCLAGSTAPANFVYAGVFAEADPYETGNFVWGEATPDPELEDSRMWVSS